MTKARWIALKDIKVDGGTQSRVALDDSAIEDYSQALDILPPVIVFDDRDNYWLADGFHRYRAHEIVGSEEILAEVRRGTQRDAILFSVGANASHGLRRTKQDKHRAVMVLLNDPEWTKWSDQEIARRCAVSQPYVSGLRAKELKAVISERTYKTKHGTTATMKTAGINAERRQREAKPVRIVERPHQEPAAPIVVEEPAELDDGALNAAERAVKRRRRFLALWEEMTPADREWISQTISHWKNSLPAHDSDTGEIIEEHAAESTASPQIEPVTVNVHSDGPSSLALSDSDEATGSFLTKRERVIKSEPASVPSDAVAGQEGGLSPSVALSINSATPLAETGSGEPERPFLVAPEPTIPTGAAIPQARDGRLTEEETVDAEAPVAAQADDLMTVKSTDPVAPIPASGVTATGGIMPDLPPMFDRRGCA